MEFQGMYDCEIMVSYPVSLLALTWSTQPISYFRLVLSPAGTIFSAMPPDGEIVGGTQACTTPLSHPHSTDSDVRMTENEINEKAKLLLGDPQPLAS
jgi:hypothetical protein